MYTPIPMTLACLGRGRWVACLYWCAVDRLADALNQVGPMAHKHQVDAALKSRKAQLEPE